MWVSWMSITNLEGVYTRRTFIRKKDYLNHLLGQKESIQIHWFFSSNLNLISYYFSWWYQSARHIEIKFSAFFSINETPLPCVHISVFPSVSCNFDTFYNTCNRDSEILLYIVSCSTQHESSKTEENPLTWRGDLFPWWKRCIYLTAILQHAI